MSDPQTAQRWLRSPLLDWFSGSRRWVEVDCTSQTDVFR